MLDNFVIYHIDVFNHVIYLKTLRLRFIPDPDINLLSIISVLSSCCCCLMGEDGTIAVCLVAPFLKFANLFIIRSPDFSDTALPSRSPVWDIPDSNAFFAIGLANFLKTDDATLFNGLKILSTISPDPLC